MCVRGEKRDKLSGFGGMCCNEKSSPTNCNNDCLDELISSFLFSFYYLIKAVFLNPGGPQTPSVLWCNCKGSVESFFFNYLIL